MARDLRRALGIGGAGCCGCGTAAAALLLVVGMFGAVLAPDEDAVPTADPAGASPSAVEESPSTAPPMPSETPSPAATPSGSSAPAPTTESAPSATPAPDPSEAPSATPDPATALGILETLEVKGRAPQTGYDRDAFSWRDDTDRNGCDTRNDVLRRDLTEITLKSATNGCVVLSGTLDSPFSGDVVAFDRESNLVDIDHVVAMSDAWQTGAAGWDDATRREFANDPLNLLAVEDHLNQQKGDGDAATWLPPNKDYRCEYVARQVVVKAAYDLWVKPAEADAIRGVLDDCDGFILTAGEAAWPAPGQGDVVATADEVPTTPQPPVGSEAPDDAPDGGSSSAYYENCTEAWEADAAPLEEGDPGYRPAMDRDGDGVACESRP